MTKSNIYQLVLMAALLIVPVSLPAQKASRKNIRVGNRQYEKGKFTEAEIDYRKAIEIDPKSQVGNYNLGNALFKQKKAKEALEKYQLTLGLEKDPSKKSAIFHNAGNSFMALKDYSNAVESYKSSLRLNPSDNETRYNLAVAQAMLKKQQQNKNKDKQNQKKDQKKDQKDQQKKQQQQNDQQKKQEQQHKQQQQQQQEQVSKEKAQQLLDALMQDEKDTQNKVKKLQMQQS
ncbi:MAG: tetratricopeptide repeat protein, partial [Bacteroidota bacterium]|nr:tetratricopeptide repeat protein [Bacteroidota bacterium]